MNRRITKIKYIEATNSHTVEVFSNIAIKEGFQPLGGVSIGKQGFIQTMVRYEKTAEEIENDFQLASLLDWCKKEASE